MTPATGGAVNAARRAVAGFTYVLKSEVARHPRLAIPLERLRGSGTVVDHRTDVVIEGFPRCASSFVVAAFRLAQEPRAIRVADHTHMPAQVLRATELGIPTLVLIRRAEGAVVSLLIRDPSLPVRPTLRGYVRFYEPLVSVRDRFVIATFDEVIRDLGGAVERLNLRFGTSFEPFVHSAENLARIEREIEDDYRSRTRAGERLERIIPRPSPVRDRLRAEVETRFRAEAGDRLLTRAEAVFTALTDRSR